MEIVEGPSLNCRCCGAQLAQADCLLSKQFHSKNGPAWLFQACVNVLSGPKEERLMTTGMHVVADISCAKCLNVVGWKYEAAAEESQKYKEGKFILERCHVVESDSNSNMSPPRAFRHPFSYPMRSSDTSESDSY